MGAPISTQLDLKALQLRIARCIAPNQLRRLLRSTFPKIYEELLERDSPAGLVDDLFRFAENHGDTDALVNTLLLKWPGLRYPRATEFTFTPRPRTARLPSLLLLILGATEDIGPPQEDLYVHAHQLLPSARTDVRPETVLPIWTALPVLKIRKLKYKPPRPPLKSLYQLHPLLKQALAPCSREAGGGFRIDLKVSSDAQGSWSHTAIMSSYSSTFHHCLTHGIEGLRTGRHDKFPANTSAPILLIYPNEPT